MPKKDEKFFKTKHDKLQDEIAGHLNTNAGSTEILLRKRDNLVKSRNRLFKHAKVQQYYRAMTNKQQIEKTVAAINVAIKGSEHKNDPTSPGKTWEKEFNENMIELGRLVDDALKVINKKLEKNKQEEKYLRDISKKIEEFQNSCLSRLKDLQSSIQKPFDIIGIKSNSELYAYEDTPFQQY